MQKKKGQYPLQLVIKILLKHRVYLHEMGQFTYSTKLLSGKKCNIQTACNQTATSYLG